MDFLFKKSQQSETQAGIFLPRQFFFFFLTPESWIGVKQETWSSNYQRTQWDCILHAVWHFDLRQNNGSNQKLSPALQLGSQPICGMFTLGFEDLHTSARLLLGLSPSPPSFRKKQKACKPSYNFLCACCVCVNKVINIYVINLKTGTLFYSIWTLKAVSYSFTDSYQGYFNMELGGTKDPGSNQWYSYYFTTCSLW